MTARSTVRARRRLFLWRLAPSSAVRPCRLATAASSPLSSSAHATFTLPARLTDAVARHRRMHMRPLIALGMAVGFVSLSSGSATAQTPAAQRECPQNTGSAAPSASQKAPDGTAKPDQQAVERSAILPSAGGHEQSAAPTVQQDGTAVVANADCPKPPNQMDAPKKQ